MNLILWDKWWKGSEVAENPKIYLHSESKFDTFLFSFFRPGRRWRIISSKQVAPYFESTFAQLLPVFNYFINAIVPDKTTILYSSLLS